MQRKPIISLSNFSNFNNEFIILFQDFRLFGKYLTLGFGNSKDPILSLIPKNLNLNTSIKEPGLNLLIGYLTNIIKRNIDLNKLFLIKKTILINSLEMKFLFLLLNDCFKSLIKNKNLRLIFVYQLMDYFTSI